MSKLVFGIRKLILYKDEAAASFNIAREEFISAYHELRKTCPKGDLIIHLYIEADSAEEVGTIFEDGKK